MNIHLLFILFLKIKLTQIAIVTHWNWTTSHLHDSRTNSFNKTIDWVVFMLAGLCIYYRFFPPQKGVHTSLCWNCHSLALWCFLFMLAIREVLDGRADSAAIISLEPSVFSKLYGSLNSQQTGQGRSLHSSETRMTSTHLHMKGSWTKTGCVRFHGRRCSMMTPKYSSLFFAGT